MNTIATFDFGDVEKGLAAMERRCHALGGVFRDLRGPLKADQKEHAKDREGPEGKWEAWAASTVEKRKRSGKRTRILGKLASAVAYTSTATEVSAESRVKWSWVHQEGGKVGRGGYTLPARPFLWLSEKVLSVAERALVNALIKAWEG